MTKRNDASDPRVRLDLANADTDLRQSRVDEVRRRLEAGELDSDLALVETALALLDGDRPKLG